MDCLARQGASGYNAGMQETRDDHSPGPQLINVCGRPVTNDPIYHYPTEFQGQTIYFCTEYCLEAFLADPERFYLAHSTKKT